MTRYVAFLRAINVGGHTVKMDDLRALFTQLDVDDVETFIASGNVIFTAPRQSRGGLESRIEQHLERELGYPVGTFIRSVAEVAAIAEHDPFPDIDLGEVTALDVALLKKAPSAAAGKRLAALSTDSDRLAAHGRELYWARFVSIRDSAVTGPLLDQALGGSQTTTVRTLNTMRRLAAKYPAD